MTRPPFAVPLRPDYAAVRDRPSDAIIRACLASARSVFRMGETAAEVAARAWPRDTATLQILTRAVTAPADTSTAGWASQLATTANVDLLTGIGPSSAASELLKLATELDFGNAAKIPVPGIAVSAAESPFVGEAAAIPVQQLQSTAALLERRKFGIIAVATRQLVEHSTPNAEKLLRKVLSECIAAALDIALFDANAGSVTRPPGLRFGVSATVATAGGGIDAMRKDLSNLAAAVAAVGGTEIAFVAAPGEALKILLSSGSEFKFPVLASSGLATGDVLCIALPALVAAVDPVPTISASREATLHMEDSVPLAIGTPGSPATVAAPVRSLLQTDSAALRVILDIAWGLRAAGALAHTSAVTW